MQTLTIDILDTKAERLLEDLEILKMIRLRKHQDKSASVINWTGGYSTAPDNHLRPDSDGEIRDLNSGTKR